MSDTSTEAPALPGDALREGIVEDLRSALGDQLLETHLLPQRDLWVRVAPDAVHVCVAVSQMLPPEQSALESQVVLQVPAAQTYGAHVTNVESADTSRSPSHVPAIGTHCW